MFTSGVEFSGIEINAILIVGVWILLSILMVYTAVVCVGIFKMHYYNTNKAWKKHFCRVWTVLAMLLPILSVVKTIHTVCLAVNG